MSQVLRAGRWLARLTGWIGLGVLVGVPLWLIVVNSFKSTAESHQPSLKLPQTWSIIDNYSTVLGSGGALRNLFNSVAVTVPSVLLILLLGAAAAWVFGRARSRGLTMLYYFSLMGLLVPPAIVTTVRMLDGVGIANSKIGLICFYSGVYMSLSIFIMTSFVKTVPSELEDAARIDGAGVLTIFFRIVLPLLSPALITTGIFLTLLIWNDFFAPFFILGKDDATLPLGLFSFASQNQYSLNWNLIFADIVVTALPLVLLYLILQKRVVSGLTSGALK